MSPFFITLGRLIGLAACLWLAAGSVGIASDDAENPASGVAHPGYQYHDEIAPQVFESQSAYTESSSLCLTGLCPLGVRAVCEYAGDLYAGGYFTSADGKPTTFIARWDGVGWHAVGGGMNHYVCDLIVYDGKLIAGGVFDTVGGVAMGHIAAWDGVSWTPLGEGVNRRPGITDICLYNGDLVVSGVFDSAGSAASPNVALWNGSSWEAFGPGVGFSAMTIYQGDLIGNNAPGGGFSRWDGTTWSTINHPINGGVYCFGVFDNKLIAGGFFATAGEDTVNHIVAWDGVSWMPLAAGVGPEYAGGRNVFVQCLFNYQGDLIVGGNFTLAGADTANFAARWDGVSWHPIGGGFGRYDYDGDIWVTSFTEYGGDLIAGGHFTTAEGIIVNRIAGWNGDNWYPLTATEGMPFTIQINQHNWALGNEEISVPVRKLAGSSTMFGFDFLISYSDLHLDFAGATPGVLFGIPGDYEWEYFSSRADSGLIRVVGVAETNDGGHHPLSGEIPNGTTLFTLDFITASVSPGEYAYTDLEFYWLDCGDNSILRDSLGYDLVISDSVYDPTGANITVHSGDFPTVNGAPDDCLDAGPTPVTRDIDFYSGYLNVVDTVQVDFRGDINLNGIPYELADWVMYSNFFMVGPWAFYSHTEASIAASDVNADGIVLDIADLYYLYRVICGDFLPPPENPPAAPVTDTLRFVQDISTRTVSVEYPDSLGAVACVFTGDITPTFLVDTSLYYCCFYRYNGKSTVVIIHPKGVFEGGDCGIGLQPGPLFSYTGQGLLIREDEMLRQTSASSCDGVRVCIFNAVLEIIGDRDGEVHVYDPDPIPAALVRISNSETLTLYVHGFGEHDAYDVNPTSVRINDSIAPLSVTAVPTTPVIPVPALEIVVSAGDFMGSYTFQPDTTYDIHYWPGSYPTYMFWEYALSVRGGFTDAATFTAFGEITITNGPALIQVPSGWPTIGEAVDIAFNGDTVLVSDGIYGGDGNRDMNIHGKSLHIRSVFGPDSTIIDCGGSPGEPHYAFVISSSGDAIPGLLEGFTISNACSDTLPAVFLSNTDFDIRNCIFENNTNASIGGAIGIFDASSNIDYCVFDGNHADTGGAIVSGGTGAPYLANCTFVANSADGLGGGLFASGGAPSVTNCIFAYGTGGGAIALDDAYGIQLITCTDIYGNTGGDWIGFITDRLGVDGNISADPLFCNPAQGDFSLEGFSPCLAYNNSCNRLMGAYGLGCGYICGDISGDWLLNIADVVFLINYLYREGPAPENFGASDLNGDSVLDVGDAVIIIDFIFRGGLPLDCQTD